MTIKSAFENFKLLYKSREAVKKSFNDHSSIVSEAKYKAIHEKKFQVCPHAELVVRYLAIQISKN